MHPQALRQCCECVMRDPMRKVPKIKSFFLGESSSLVSRALFEGTPIRENSLCNCVEMTIHKNDTFYFAQVQWHNHEWDIQKKYKGKHAFAILHLRLSYGATTFAWDECMTPARCSISDRLRSVLSSAPFMNALRTDCKGIVKSRLHVIHSTISFLQSHFQETKVYPFTAEDKALAIHVANKLKTHPDIAVNISTAAQLLQQNGASIQGVPFKVSEAFIMTKTDADEKSSVDITRSLMYL